MKYLINETTLDDYKRFYSIELRNLLSYVLFSISYDKYAM